MKKREKYIWNLDSEYKDSFDSNVWIEAIRLMIWMQNLAKKDEQEIRKEKFFNRKKLVKMLPAAAAAETIAR